MKILQICPYDFQRPGGVKTHILGLSKHLERLGHSVTILAPKTPGYQNSTEKKLRFFGKNKSAKFAGTKIDLNISTGSDHKDLIYFIKNSNFEVIHYHSVLSPILSLQIRRHSKSRNIVTFHNTPPNNILSKVSMSLTTSILSKYFDEIISVSKSQAKYLGNFSKKRINVIPNGIDLEEINSLKKNSHSSSDNKFDFLFLSRIEDRKGLIYALNAFHKLKAEFPDTRLLIAGGGDKNSVDKMKEHSKKLKTKDVVFMGQVSEEIKNMLYLSSDCYVAPAIYGESFGIVLLEAMAYSLPIVGFSNEGYLNVIDKEWLDLFPRPKDTNGLYKAMKTIYTDYKIRNKFILYGKNKSLRFCWKKIAKRIEAIY